MMPMGLLFLSQNLRLCYDWACFYWQVGGATPVLKQTPGRPLLTQTHLKSLSELQPFFNTLCHAGTSEADYIVGNQRSGKYATQNGLGQGHRKGIPKSRSTPAQIDKIQRGDPQLSAQQKSSRQFIEDLVGRDFLEPCPLHWQDESHREGNERGRMGQDISSIYTDKEGKNTDI